MDEAAIARLVLGILAAKPVIFSKSINFRILKRRRL